MSLVVIVSLPQPVIPGGHQQIAFRKGNHIRISLPAVSVKIFFVIPYRRRPELLALDPAADEQYSSRISPNANKKLYQWSLLVILTDLFARLQAGEV
jgi:hypothetical protein